MRRHEWLAELAAHTIEMLPARHRPFLLAIPGLDTANDPYGTPLLGHAALVADICVRYDTAYSANALSARLASVGLAPDGAGPKDICDELVRPTFQAMRMGRIPLDDWWSPRDLHSVVFGWYVRCRRAELGQDRLREELKNRWELPESARDALNADNSPAVPTVPAELGPPGQETTVGALWQTASLLAALDEEIARLPETARLHEDLWQLAVAGARYRV